MSETAKGPLIGFAIFMFIGLVIGFSAGYGIGSNYLGGRLDRELTDGRARIVDLERRNGEIADLADRLAGRLDTAAGIVESISGSGKTALEQVRATIANLKNLKEILRR